MLLIRPFLRLNKERMKPFHVVLFIFSVSNCGGVLTPIGDPPLFLGYINGVPFEWTIVHCFLPWLLTNGVLLAVFYVLDSRTGSPRVRPAVNTVTFAGWGTVICLAAILAGVFIDRFLATAVSPHFAEWPIGAMVMLLAAFVGYRISDPRTLEVNDFHFGPIKEVALLFVGIFATMMPALDYLAAHASQLGIQSPGGFYFAAGSLSSVLDNAPAYLSFLSAALGLKGLALDPGGVQQFAIQYPQHLRAISLGAVFFGACTYIGNGPNFMVKAIADSAGVKTPGFFAYILKFVVPILVPLYVLVWYVFL